MGFTDIEIWLGLYLLLAILSFVILTPSKKQFKITNDSDALQIVKETLEDDEVERYGVTSITRMNETGTTTVIIETDVSSVAIEIDNITGKIISKEKLIL
jgi:hypothetical protein